MHIVDDPIVAYWQGEKMSHLTRVALRHGAAWVVPFDADEMWKGTERRTIAEVLRGASSCSVTATWWDYAPLEQNGHATVARRFPYRTATPHHQVKTAFRPNWFARITIGNHNVSLPEATSATGLRIAHYRTRSVDQVVVKARDGVHAIEAAGLRSAGLPQWFTINDTEDAEQGLAQLRDADDLVFDPSDAW